jgi:hypothetical protein
VAKKASRKAPKSLEPDFSQSTKDALESEKHYGGTTLDDLAQDISEATLDMAVVMSLICFGMNKNINQDVTMSFLIELLNRSDMDSDEIIEYGRLIQQSASSQDTSGMLN